MRADRRPGAGDYVPHVVAAAVEGRQARPRTSRKTPAAPWSFRQCSCALPRGEGDPPRPVDRRQPRQCAGLDAGELPARDDHPRHVVAGLPRVIDAVGLGHRDLFAGHAALAGDLVEVEDRPASLTASSSLRRRCSSLRCMVCGSWRGCPPKTIHSIGPAWNVQPIRSSARPLHGVVFLPRPENWP